MLLCISKVGCNCLFYKISKLFVVLGALRCVIGFMNLFSRISLWAAYVHNFCVNLKTTAFFFSRNSLGSISAQYLQLKPQNECFFFLSHLFIMSFCVFVDYFVFGFTYQRVPVIYRFSLGNLWTPCTGYQSTNFICYSLPWTYCVG